VSPAVKRRLFTSEQGLARFSLRSGADPFLAVILSAAKDLSSVPRFLPEPQIAAKGAAFCASQQSRRFCRSSPNQIRQEPLECGGSAAAFEQPNTPTKSSRSLATKNTRVTPKRSEGPASRDSPLAPPQFLATPTGLSPSSRGA
jgi:hypothetical protein